PPLNVAHLRLLAVVLGFRRSDRAPHLCYTSVSAGGEGSPFHHPPRGRGHAGARQGPPPPRLSPPDPITGPSALRGFPLARPLRWCAPLVMDHRSVVR